MVLAGYLICLECNYQFLIEYDSHCPKCGNGNPKYNGNTKDNQELMNMISKMTDIFTAHVNEISLKIEKIEQQLRAYTHNTAQ